MNCIAPGPIETEVMIWTFSCFCLDSLDCFAFCLIMLGFCLDVCFCPVVFFAGSFWQTGPHRRSRQNYDGSDTSGGSIVIFEEGQLGLNLSKFGNRGESER